MTLRYECNLNMEFFTIGYEGASLEDFLASLKNGIIAIDILEVISWKRGFSKSALKSALGGEAGTTCTKRVGRNRRGASRSKALCDLKRFLQLMNTEKAQNDLMKAAEIINNNRASFFVLNGVKTAIGAHCCKHLCSMSANKINIGVQMGMRNPINYQRTQ